MVSISAQDVAIHLTLALHRVKALKKVDMRVLLLSLIAIQMDLKMQVVMDENDHEALPDVSQITIDAHTTYKSNGRIQ